MDNQITRADARKLLNCQTNYQLAKALGCTHQYVYQWRDGEPIPPPMQDRVRELAGGLGRDDVNAMRLKREAE